MPATPATPPTIRPIRPEELEPWFAAFATAFYVWPSDPAALAELRRPHLDLERVIGAFDGEAIVGTYRTFPTRLTLPGGARVGVNAVSGVSVRPTHRRRGLLSRMAARDAAAAAERGDAASILIAAEWPIYGRFGYGPATWQAQWTIPVRATGFDVRPTGSIEIVDARAARAVLPELYDRCAASQPGEIARPEHRWDFDLGLVEFPGRPRWRGSIVVHRDDAGRPDGYARFHGEERWTDGVPDHQLLLDELRAVTLDAEVDLWRHLAQMDLTSVISAEVRRPAEPVKWYLTNPRVARVTGTTDFLWLRLLDVAAVLGARRYERDGELVLDVGDEVDGKPGPAAGRYRLVVSGGTATCERTDAAPDLSIGVGPLSAAALGGTRLRDATATLPWTEHRGDALREAEAMLLTADAPWCATWF